MAFSSAPRFGPAPAAVPPRASPAGVAGAAARSFDERPVGTGRTTYNLDFWDGDNEYESFGLRALQRDEEAFHAYFARYTEHLANGGGVTDADFERHFTYERLLELDEALVKKGGLSRAETEALLEPRLAAGGEPCPVCMTDATKGDRVAVLSCGHTFHVHCLSQWLARSHTCPICRKDLREVRDGFVVPAAPAAGPGRGGDGDDSDRDAGGVDDGTAGVY